MPLPITLAHKLVRRLTDVRKSNELDFLRPDGKSQVTIEFTWEATDKAEALRAAAGVGAREAVTV